MLLPPSQHLQQIEAGDVDCTVANETNTYEIGKSYTKDDRALHFRFQHPGGSKRSHNHRYQEAGLGYQSNQVNDGILDEFKSLAGLYRQV